MNNYIEDDIGEVVAAMRLVEDGDPYYMFGHRLEIANRLILKNTSPLEAAKKYPLIALKLDNPEEMGNDFLENNGITIAIITSTDKNYNAEQRLENVFKPILEPLYEKFMQALRDSGLFVWEGNQDYPPHTKVRRYFYGTLSSEGNSTQNIFSDPIDAIEILNLRLKSEIKC